MVDETVVDTLTERTAVCASVDWGAVRVGKVGNTKRVVGVCRLKNAVDESCVVVVSGVVVVLEVVVLEVVVLCQSRSNTSPCEALALLISTSLTVVPDANHNKRVHISNLLHFMSRDPDIDPCHALGWKGRASCSLRVSVRFPASAEITARTSQCCL